MYGTRYIADFVGDKTYYIPPKIHKNTCKTCSGTGIKPVSPTPDSIEEQDEIQEDTTSMEEKLEALDFLSEGAKSIDPTDSWESAKKLGLECIHGNFIGWCSTCPKDYQDYSKSFISEVRQKAYDDGFEKGRAHGYEVANGERHFD